jgi:hypothetical protein
MELEPCKRGSFLFKFYMSLVVRLRDILQQAFQLFPDLIVATALQ